MRFKDASFPLNPADFYQVGGSLRIGMPTYVERQADRVLFEYLRQGELCYVFNARQMGKSSLRLRIKHRLQCLDVHCASIDMSRMGSDRLTPLQWYKSIAIELLRGFNLLTHVSFKDWWQAHEGLSPPLYLHQLIDEVLLPRIPGEMVIFIDEIDSVLGLPFATDDFFTLIRFCHNQRAENPDYRRLTFALFGVATPVDLIGDLTRTPFNIGHAVPLAGFQPSEVQPLVQSLAPLCPNPQSVMEEILYWTGGQPFLTQKVCWLLTQTEWGKRSQDPPFQWVAEVVRTRIIDQWESQDDPEHLRTIRDRLLRDPKYQGRLLGLYQQILQTGSLKADDSPEQRALLLTGLIVHHHRHLHILNPIYEAVFNANWVEQQFQSLRPYAPTLQQWVASHRQDPSRLLQGQALQDALTWAADKQLSDLDHHYLGASLDLDRRQAQQQLEAERLQSLERQLVQERKNIQLQRILLIISGITLTITAALGGFAFSEHRKAIVQEIEALSRSSEALLAVQRRFDGLLDAIHASQELKRSLIHNPVLQDQTDGILRQILYETHEVNRLSDHRAWVNGVAFSPNGQLIASASLDNTAKLWRRNGQLLATITGHPEGVNRVAFSPNSQMLLTTSYDKTAKLWNIQDPARPQLITTAVGHQDMVWDAEFSPDGQTFATASLDGTAKLWDLKGRLRVTFRGHQAQVFGLSFSPDGQTLATASSDRTLKLWDIQGPLRKTLVGHREEVNDVAFSRDGTWLASVSSDKTVGIWGLDGRLRQQLRGPGARLWAVAIAPNDQTLATVGEDNILHLWSKTGHLLETFAGHQGALWGVAYSPDGNTLATASGDHTVKLWQTHNDFRTLLRGHSERVWAIAVSPDSQRIATGSADKSVRLWHRDGTPWVTLNHHTAEVTSLAFAPDQRQLASASWDKTIQLWSLDPSQDRIQPSLTLKGHRAGVSAIAFSPDQTLLASGSFDKTVKLWRRDGTVVNTLLGHQGEINEVAFSPDSQRIVTASGDKTLKLWTRQGTLLKTLTLHTAKVLDATFSPDGTKLAAASWDGTVSLWSAEGTLLQRLQTHEGGVNTVTFSPDSQYFATTGNDHWIKLWSRSGQLLKKFRGHTEGIYDLTFAPNGEWLASVSDDHSAKLWNWKKIVTLVDLTYGCQWVKDYLQFNTALEPEDRQLCR